MTMMPHRRTATVAFAGLLSRDANRLDLAAITGLDTDLVLGPELETPEAERIRLDALAGMLESGFISDADIARGYGRAVVLADELGLDVYLAGVVDDIEGEDDADGWASDYTGTVRFGRPALGHVTDDELFGEADELFRRGWAA